MSSPTGYHNSLENGRPDPEVVRGYLEVVTTPGAPFEVRILNTRRGGPNRLWARTYSGFFTDVATAVEWVCRYTGADCAGIYVTLNLLADYVLNWNQACVDVAVTSAADEDVIRLQWLFLDIDPTRPRFTCATNAEQEAAKIRGNEIAHFLMSDLHFPMPAWVGSSGSGATALWQIDLPVEDASIVERCLAALSAMFTDEEVNVDSGVGNPARIARIAGTINAKSPTPQPDRPWRMATGKAFETAVVTREQLEELAALAPKEAPRAGRGDGPYDGPAYDLRKLLDDAGIQYTEKERTYGTAYDLASCLTSDEHDTGASFFQFNSGAVSYRCLHDSCAGKGWQDVKPQLGIRDTPYVSGNRPQSSSSSPIRIKGTMMNDQSRGRRSDAFTPIKVINGQVRR